MVTIIEAITDTIEYRPLNALTTWPRNYRDGDVGAIITSILKFGFNGALRVWRDNVVMAGNHTLLALQSMQAQQLDVPRGVRVEDGDWLVPCVDISHLNETQAQAFAIADNRTTELAHNDPESLANLLQELAMEDTALLEATGYDGDDLDDILYQLNPTFDPCEEWQGMPEFEQEDVDRYKSLIIHFNTEEDYREFAELIQQKLTPQTRFIYYPELQHIDGAKYRVKNES